MFSFDVLRGLGSFAEQPAAADASSGSMATSETIQPSQVYANGGNAAVGAAPGPAALDASSSGGGRVVTESLQRGPSTDILCVWFKLVDCREVELGEMRAELDAGRTHVFDLCMAARSMCESAIRCDAFQIKVRDPVEDAELPMRTDLRRRARSADGTLQTTLELHLPANTMVLPTAVADAADNASTYYGSVGGSLYGDGNAEWVPDEAFPDCQVCHKYFWMFRRRHHCRKCGTLCCRDCSRKRLILGGVPKRTCDTCYAAATNPDMRPPVPFFHPGFRHGSMGSLSSSVTTPVVARGDSGNEAVTASPARSAAGTHTSTRHDARHAAAESTYRKSPVPPVIADTPEEKASRGRTVVADSTVKQVSLAPSHGGDESGAANEADINSTAADVSVINNSHATTTMVPDKSRVVPPSLDSAKLDHEAAQTQPAAIDDGRCRGAVLKDHVGVWKLKRREGGFDEYMKAAGVPKTLHNLVKGMTTYETEVSIEKGVFRAKMRSELRNVEKPAVILDGKSITPDAHMGGDKLSVTGKWDDELRELCFEKRNIRKPELSVRERRTLESRLDVLVVELSMPNHPQKISFSEIFDRVRA